MPLPQYRQCCYSAFLSYATGDDIGWDRWISHFNKELKSGLMHRVGEIPRKLTYEFSADGDIQGQVEENLRKAVSGSFCMMIFVHDNYLTSRYCLKELELFVELYGKEGFKSRLYIIAMSKVAILNFQKRPEWKRLVPYGDPIWIDFYREEESEQELPVLIYAQDRKKRELILSNEFCENFYKLRENLAKKIKAAYEEESAEPAYPTDTVVPVTPGDLEGRKTVRLYVESNPEQQRFYESLSQDVVAVWDQVLAQDPEKEEPPLRLRPTGLPMQDIEDRPLLADADGVILLWVRKTPESLAAQIMQVEPKLYGPHPAPGLIAYLVEGGEDRPVAKSISNWKVIRCRAHQDGSTDVFADDQPILKDFLREVLKHKHGPH